MGRIQFRKLLGRRGANLLLLLDGPTSVLYCCSIDVFGLSLALQEFILEISSIAALKVASDIIFHTTIG
jgi:hypothetical protein